MAAIDLRPRAAASFGGTAKSIYARTFGAVQAWNDARVTRNALSQLSTHELSDIGLHRGEIEAVAGRALR
ncbi:MAG: DUF1127 domain-containing protein [Shimia sp.]